MKATTIHKALIVLPIALLASSLRGQEDAREIFKKAADQVLTDKMELTVHVETVEQNGRSEEKEYDILIGRFGNAEKTRMIMQQPERARGITVVITALPGETGVIEVFTPSNGKVRKMKATPENMARFGSTMVLSGYSSQEIDDLEISLAGSGEEAGKTCYLLDVKEREDPDAVKARLMVDEDNYRLLKILFYDLEGNNSGFASLSDYQPVQGTRGKIQPMRIESQDFIEKTVTRMQLLKVTPRPDLKEEEFVLEEIAE
jgi:outer membrane lipoprotein-sorting protein